MRVFEYEEDLYHYYHVGYGQKINSKLGCQPLRDMLERFTWVEVSYLVDSRDSLVSSFLTTNDPAGNWKERRAATGQRVCSISRTRRWSCCSSPRWVSARTPYRSGRQTSGVWIVETGEHPCWCRLPRTSRLSSTGTFVLRQILFLSRLLPTSSSRENNHGNGFCFSCDSVNSPLKVAFYLAEKPLTLEGCENGVCDWMRLKRKLGDMAANCSPRFCRREKLWIALRNHEVAS